MTLYLVGLGLYNIKDLTLRGIEAIRKSSLIYLEGYTSRTPSLKGLEKFFGKRIRIADRNMVETEAEQTILRDAKEKDIAFLVAGDPLCATTHIDLILRAKKLGIKTEIIHNASIISAIGTTGLSVYKFGKIVSIPFEHAHIKSPINALKENKSLGLHTLFLLDLDPFANRFLRISEAADYLIRNGVPTREEALGCARIGYPDQKIVYAGLSKLKQVDFGKPPYCIVIPGELHFIEQEALERWRLKKN